MRRVLSERAAQQILEIMATVTQPGGTAKEAAPEGFTVAGKTGTAQKLEGRSYSHTKFDALFIGLIPAEKPVLAISVIIDEPKGAIYGGVVAAPVFREIAAQSMRVLGYYPQQELERDKNLPVQAKAAAPDQGRRTAAAALCKAAGSHVGGVVADPAGDAQGTVDGNARPEGLYHSPGTGPADPLRIEMPPGGQRHGCEPGALPGDQPLPRRRLPGEIPVR